MDNFGLSRLSELTLRVETDRHGPFVFQIGLDPAQLVLPMQRVEDAHQIFSDSPLAQVANRLEREVIASSIFGTNTIEGGTLTEDETAAAMDMPAETVRGIEELRVVNLRAAYDEAQKASAAPGWRLSVEFVCRIHSLITQGIPHPDNKPGLLRDTPKHRVTVVGDEAHGGRYKPPQFGSDVRRLLHALMDWHTQLQDAGIHPLIRAPLVHYYYELIHPFWDGNGRVGRVIEATLLLSEGYRYAPFAMARYYLENIDAYFSQFNACRKAASKHLPHPNTGFVLLHQEGMRQTILSLQKRTNRIISLLLFETHVRDLLDKKEINARQYTILAQLRAGPIPINQMRVEPWYTSLYLKLGEKTKTRDLRGLRALQLAYLDLDNQIFPGFIKPPNIKPL